MTDKPQQTICEDVVETLVRMYREQVSWKKDLTVREFMQNRSGREDYVDLATTAIEKALRQPEAMRA